MKRIYLFLFAFILFSTNLMSQAHDVELDYKINADNSLEILYTKHKVGSYTVYLHFTRLINAHNRRVEKVITNKKGTLCTVRPMERAKPIQFDFRYYYHKGKVNPKVKKDLVYTLPVKKGGKVYVHELAHINKVYFHEDIPVKNWKSFQFEVDRKDTILAVRKGRVVEIDDRFAPDTSDVYSYKRYSNMIRVEHVDGSFSQYKGFDRNKIFVNTGDIVYPQKPLGMLERFDKRDIYKLTFTAYFLIRDNEKDEIRNSIKIKGRSTECINPFFSTSDGIVQIKAGNFYSSDYTNDVIVEEMNRIEKKKLRKGKLNK